MRWKGDRKRMAFMSVPIKAILMLRAPVEGQVKRRLAESIGDAAALMLYRWMGQRQLEGIPSSWSVEVRFTPDCAGDRMEAWLGKGPRFAAQGAGDLGERMRQAAEFSFDKEGFQKLIFLGADCLALDEKILVKAAHGLKDKDFVLGPALDGGYYLLGMRRYESIVFENVNWGSSSVFAETVDRIRKSGASLELLETLSDIDDWESLEHEKNRIDRDIRETLGFE